MGLLADSIYTWPVIRQTISAGSTERIDLGLGLTSYIIINRGPGELHFADNQDRAADPAQAYQLPTVGDARCRSSNDRYLWFTAVGGDVEVEIERSGKGRRPHHPDDGTHDRIVA